MHLIFDAFGATEILFKIDKCGDGVPANRFLKNLDIRALAVYENIMSKEPRSKRGCVCDRSRSALLFLLNS